MFTYTGLRNHFGTLVKNTDSTTLTLGDTLINQATRELIDARNWDFKEGQQTIATVADQDSYTIPANVDKIWSVTVTIDEEKYNPEEISSRQDWDWITSTDASSDIPAYYYIYDKKVYLYPTPATADNTITLNYQKVHKDLSIADYTTGTITTATNGDETIVGNGTSWTAQMAGFALKITGTSTANTGDNRWYLIDTITNATNLELETKYLGNSIAAGSATYTIGEVSILPEEYQVIPVYKAAEIYFTSQQPEPTRAQLFSKMYGDAIQIMQMGQGKSSDPVINLYDKKIINPNNYYVV